MPVVLTVAGSDPSGGAGIQSDLRTFSTLGVHGVSVITGLTVQNSQGVQEVYPVDSETFRKQLAAILDDIQPDAVKIGMLCSAVQVEILANVLAERQQQNVVLDPVFSATIGAHFLDIEGVTKLITDLIPLSTLVTPNLDEATRITGVSMVDKSSALRAAGKLIDLGAQAALVKGGHAEGDADDVLMISDGRMRTFTVPRIETSHTHGTGCLLSSLIAGKLALGREIVTAVAEAKALLTEALHNPVIIGHGRGYPLVPKQAVLQQEAAWTQQEWRKKICGLYLITDSILSPGRGPKEIVQAGIQGGAKVFQLREKGGNFSEQVALARQLAQMVHDAHGVFIINDRADIAAASGADGVHLGPDDISPRDVRELLGPEKLVGVSVANLDEAAKAVPYATYFGVGAIYGTQSKADAGAAIGLGKIREIKTEFPDIPLVAIGGINSQNISAVAESGADSAAVISAVVSAPDMAAAAEELICQFNYGCSLRSRH